FDPILVMLGNWFEPIDQVGATLGGETRERFHAKFNIGDVLIRRHALDFGDRHRFGMDAANPATLTFLPCGSAISADSIFLHIAVMEIGEAKIRVVSIV